MESKFVDVLRTVAAEMTMTDMHEQRANFCTKSTTKRIKRFREEWFRA